MEEEFDAELDELADLELEDVSFEGNWWQHATHGEVSVAVALATQEAADRIKHLVSNEFLIEAYVAATQIRNMLGDVDGFAAENAERIRSNIVCLALEMARDPGGLVNAILRSMDPRKALETGRGIVNAVEALCYHIERELEGGDDGNTGTDRT